MPAPGRIGRGGGYLGAWFPQVPRPLVVRPPCVLSSGSASVPPAIRVTRDNLSNNSYHSVNSRIETFFIIIHVCVNIETKGNESNLSLYANLVFSVIHVYV